MEAAPDSAELGSPVAPYVHTSFLKTCAASCLGVVLLLAVCAFAVLVIWPEHHRADVRERMIRWEEMGIRDYSLTLETVPCVPGCSLLRIEITVEGNQIIGVHLQQLNGDAGYIPESDFHEYTRFIIDGLFGEALECVFPNTVSGCSVEYDPVYSYPHRIIHRGFLEGPTGTTVVDFDPRNNNASRLKANQ